MQNVVGVALGNGQTQLLRGGLQTCADTGDGAVVVGALDVNDLGKAALPFGQVVGNIGHKIGVAAVRFTHHAVFVVAKIGGAQPQRTVLFVGVTRGVQRGHGLIDTPIGVQTGL